MLNLPVLRTLTAVAVLSCATVSFAAPALYWDPNVTISGTGGGTGTWDIGSWWNGASDIGWTTGDDAYFGGSSGTATILNGVSVNNLYFNTAGYVVTGNSLTLTGGTVTANANATIISPLAGSVGLTVIGRGVLTLNGSASNQYTGATTIYGSSVLLDFTNMAPPTPTNLIGSGNALALGGGSLGGGSLGIKGLSTGTTSQAFNGVTVGAGANILNFNSNSGSLNVALGSVTRSNFGTIDVTLPSSGAVSATVPGTNNSAVVDASGSWNNFMTVNGGQDWAAINGGNIVPLGSLSLYTSDAFSTGGNAYQEHMEVTKADSLSTSTSSTVGDMRFNGNFTLTISGGNPLQVNAGGILVPPTASTGATITGGTIAGSGGGAKLSIFDYGKLTIASVINNTSTAVVFTGTGTTILSGLETYTGVTVINQGTVQLNTATGNSTGELGGTPSITVNNGGKLALNASDVIGYTSGKEQLYINSGGTVSNITSSSRVTINDLITINGGLFTGVSTSSNGNFSIDDGANGFNATSDALGNPAVIGASISFQNTNCVFTVTRGSAAPVSDLNVTAAIVPYQATGANYGIIKQGNGVMTLSGANTYLGETFVSNGTLNFNGAGTVLSGTGGNVEVGTTSGSSGVMQFQSNAVASFTGTADGAFTVNWGSTLNIFPGASVTVASDLKLGSLNNGSIGTAVQSGGTLNITGFNASNSSRALVIGEYPTETSSYTLTGGSLNVLNGATFLAGNGAGILNISGGSANLEEIGFSQFSSSTGGTLNVSGGLVLVGSGGIIQIFDAANSANVINLSGGTLGAYASWSSSMAMNLSNTTTVNSQSNSITLSGALTGGGGLNKIGTGILILSNTANSYGGGTNISGGTLQLGSASGLGATTGNLSVSNGALTVNGFSPTVAAVAVSSGSILDSSGTATLTGTSYSAQSASIGVALAGASAPLNATGGLVTLTASNSYGGGTTVSAGTLQLGDGASRIGAVTGNIGMANNAALVFANPTAQQYSGAISGTGNVTKTAAGALTLSGINTYSGVTTLSAGTLTINGSLLSSGSVNTAAGTTLSGSGSVGSTTIAGGGAIDVSQNGANSLTLAGLTFSGNASINFGSIANFLSVPALSISGALVENGGINSVNLTYPSSLFVPSGTYNLISFGSESGPGPTLAFIPPPNTASDKFSLSDTGSVLQLSVSGDFPIWTGANGTSWSGANNWVLANAGAPTTFASGEAAQFSDAAITSAGTTAVTNSTVNISSGNVFPTSVTFNNNVLSYTLTGSNGIAGAATTLTMTGTGTVTIANANSYGGGTYLTAGLLCINNSAALGTGALTITGGSIDNTSGAAITLATNNAMNWNSDITFLGSNNLNLGTGAVTLASSRTVTVVNGSLTVGGAIGGVGMSLTSAGLGNLILAGANTYNSGTVVLSGTLTAANNAALSTGPVTLSPSSGTAVLAFTSATPTIGSLTNNGASVASVVLGNATSGSSTNLSIGSNNTSTTFSGTIGDLVASNSAATGSLTKIGNGTFTLATPNSYTGGTTLSSGILNIGNTAALGSGPLAMNGGTAQVGFASSGGVPALMNNIIVNNAAGNTLNAVAGYDLPIGGNLSGSGSLTTIGPNSVYLEGNNASFSGSYIQSAGNTYLSSGGSAGSAVAVWTINSGNLSNTASGAQEISLGALSGAGGMLGNNDSMGGQVTYSIGALNTNTVFGGTITDSLGNGGTTALFKTGSGVLTLASANTYSGGTTINNGTLQIGNNGNEYATALGSGTVTINAATLSLQPGGTTNVYDFTNSFVLNGGTVTGGDGLQHLGTGGSATITVASSGTVQSTWNGKDVYLDGQLTGSGSLAIQNGPGSSHSNSAVVHITNDSNTYTGTVTLNAAVNKGEQLSIDADNALALASLNVNGTPPNPGTTGGTSGLVFTTNAPNVGALSGNGNFAISTGVTLSVNGIGASTTYSGLIGGPGALTMDGTGMLTLSAANTLSGPTTVNSGTLALAFDSSQGAIGASPITVASGATLLTTVEDALGYSSTASLTISGTLTKGANVAGTNANHETLFRPITLNGGTITSADAGDTTGGEIGQVYNMLGDTISTAASSGNSFITLPTGGNLLLRLSGTNAPAFNLGANSTLVVNATIGNFDASDPLNVNGSGTMLLLGSNTYTGATNISGATLQVGNGGSGALISSSSAIVNNGTLIFDHTDSVTVNAPISGNGNLIHLGTGLLNLGGNNTYGGGTTVSAGTLQLGYSNALGTGGLTANAGVLDLAGYSPSVAGLSGSAGVITNSGIGSPATLSVNQVAASTFSGLLLDGASTVGLSIGGGSQTLMGNNTYSGATTINAGALIAGAANTLSSISAVTIYGGLLDVTAGSQTIASLTMYGGALNLNVGNLLTATGFSTLGGALNVFGSTSGTAELISLPSSYSGTFAVGAMPGGYTIGYNANDTEIDLIKIVGPPTWNVSTSGSWTAGSNWTTNPTSPSGQGVVAVLGTATTLPTTINLDSAQTLGMLVFNNSAGYTLAVGNSGSLTMDNTGGTGDASIVVLSGTHCIAAPLTLAGTNTAITVVSGANLSISGNILDGSGGGNASLSLSSSDNTGILSLSGSNTFGGGMFVNSGALILNGAASLLAGSSLTIGSGAGPGAIFSSPSAIIAAAPAVAPVPEPSSLVLLAIASLCGMMWAGRRTFRR